MPSSLITMAEFWLYTGSSLSEEGFEAAYLVPASIDAQNYCDDKFGVRTITGEKKMSPLTLDQDLRIDFNVKPVSSVSSVSLVYGSNETELSIAEADLFQVPGYMLIPFGSASVCQARVLRSGLGIGYLTLGDEYITKSAYIGGEIVPVPVKQAVAYLAWEAYLVLGKIGDTADPSGGTVKSFSIGQYSETKGKVFEGTVKVDGTLGWGTGLSLKAEEKLLPYKKNRSVILGVL